MSKHLGHRETTRAVRQFLLERIKAGDMDVIESATTSFNLSRQSVSKHLNWLADNNFLIAHGKTRGRTYTIGKRRFFNGTYNLATIDESSVLHKDFSFIFSDLPENLSEICDYGFTEILNNAIDHSEGTEVFVDVELDADNITILIQDNGQGIFKRITSLLKLADEREAILELSKGKLTTDPENHSGEGIFFTSRAFDHFAIASGELRFSHEHNQQYDFLTHHDENIPGTLVWMKTSLSCKRDLTAIFDEFAAPDAFRFERTIVPVRLAIYEGEHLISRSQAKRLMNRVERFRHVELDFDGVNKVGQAFADEIFRVFQHQHPNTTIIASNTTEQINKMIERATPQQGSLP